MSEPKLFTELPYGEAMRHVLKRLNLVFTVAIVAIIMCGVVAALFLGSRWIGGSGGPIATAILILLVTSWGSNNYRLIMARREIYELKKVLDHDRITRQESRITSAPGTKLIAFIRLIYSAKTVERIFDPIYADFCEEYFAALDAGEKWHARWIQVRYYKDFVKAVSLFGVVRLAKTVFEHWEEIA